MYILPRYVLKELFNTFVPAFLGFGFLMMLGLTIQLMHKGLDIIDIRIIIPYLMLYACPNTLPISLLTAAVLSYGRLSSTNEIIAIRTSGIHLHAIITPVLVISFLLSFFTLYLNAEVLPMSRLKIKLLQEKAVSAILSRHLATIKKKLVFEPYHIYIGNIEKDVYKNLAIIEYVRDFVTSILLAEEGKIIMTDGSESVILRLKRGDFVKMNYQKPTDIPRTGTFDEMSFEIPLHKKDIPISKKYLTLLQLYKERREMYKELADGDLYHSEDIKKIGKISDRRLQSLKQQYNDTIEGQQSLASEIESLNNRININMARAENLINDIRVLENKIAASNIEQERIKSAITEKRDSVETRDKIDQLNNTINSYIEGKKAKEKELSGVSNLIKKDKAGLTSKNTIVPELLQKAAELKEKESSLAGYSRLAKINEEINDYTILIHKRLASSFLCITFALIGIPLGIMTKSGNILIGFGISFLLVVLIYYPLTVIGEILANNSFPIIPAIWGPDGILTILGIILFRKSLVR